MSSLLEEAIVDATALKDAALKNAETAVLEKYSVEVRQALNTLLEQDDLGIGAGAPAPAPTGDAGYIQDVAYAFQGEELGSPAQQEIIEIDFDALKNRINAEEEEVAGDDLLAAELTADALGGDLAPEAEMAPEAPAPDLGGMDALQEAEDAISALGDEEEGEDEAELSGQGSARTLPEDIELTEEMLSALIEELVVDMVPRPQGWSAQGSAYNSVEQANNDAMAAAQDAHAEALEEEEEEAGTAPDVVPDIELYESKIASLSTSVTELRGYLLQAKSQLEKLNLENAKLVYQNKALGSTSLNERQISRIVEAVRHANSVEEARVIFETAENTVRTATDHRTRPQTLREAVTRPTSLLINRKSEATQSDPQTDRMLRLAGLKKQ